MNNLVAYEGLINMRDEIILVNLKSFNLLIDKHYREAFVNNKYDIMSSKLVKYFLQNGDTFVDVEANFGYYSILAAKSVSDINIIAITSKKEYIYILRKNFYLNNCNQYEIIESSHYTISSDNRINTAKPSAATVFPEHPDIKLIKKRPNKEKTIDEIINGKKADFIKMDTEGNEVAVLTGMEKTIRKNYNLKILIKINPKQLTIAGFSFEDVIKKIRSYKFEIILVDDVKEQFFRLGRDIEPYWDIIAAQGYVNLFLFKKGTLLTTTFFSHSAQIGGAELMLSEMLRYTSTQQKLLCNLIINGEGPLSEKVADLPVSVHNAQFPWIIISGNDTIQNIDNKVAAFLPKIINLINLINPSLICTRTSVINVGAIIAKLFNIPHVWWITEFGEIDHGFKYNQKTKERMKFIDDFSDYVIFNSKAVEEYYTKYIPKKKGEVIYYYMDIDYSKSLNETIPMVFEDKSILKLLVLGTIHEGKGQIDAVKAVEIIKNRGIKAKLVLAGHCSENYIKKLKKYIEKKGLEESVEFLSFVNNPYPLIKAADIVLVCSRNEAFGRITIEAMLLGTPVIGTSSGGTKELIEDGKSGLLYSSSNHQELAEKIITLANNTNLRNQIIKNARKLIKTSSYSVYVTKIYKAFEKAQKNHRRNLAECDFSVNYLRNIIGIMSANQLQSHIQVSSMQDEIDARNSRIQTLEDEIDAQAKHIQSLDEHIKTLGGEITLSDKHIQSLNGDLQTLYSKIQELQGKVQSLQQDVEVREIRIGSIYQSLSWRLTSLLRKLRNIWL